MLKRPRRKASDESGWSLVELLVSMLILGLITAIAVPSFANQRRGGEDTTTKAIARSTAAAVEAYAQENLGAYDGISDTKISQINSSIPLDQIDVSGYGDCPNSAFTICYIVDAFPAPPATGTKFHLLKLRDGSYLADCDTDPNQSGWQHGPTGKGAGGCPSNGDWYH